MDKDKLEEEGLLEICKNCKSLNIKELSMNGLNHVVCGDCGTTDFVEKVSEEEYEDKYSGNNLLI